MESILTGNATYVFGNDWREVLSLTKAEVIHEDLHKDRIIHVKGWEDIARVSNSPIATIDIKNNRPSTGDANA